MLDCKSCSGSLTTFVMKGRTADQRKSRFAFVAAQCQNIWIIVFGELNANICGVRWRTAALLFIEHAGFWYLKFPESFLALLSTANRPMFCRKPGRLKGDWDMFSLVISSYIFLNQTWTKCEYEGFVTRVTRGLHAECDKNLPISFAWCSVKSKAETHGRYERLILGCFMSPHNNAILRHVWTVIQLFCSMLHRTTEAPPQTAEPAAEAPEAAVGHSKWINVVYGCLWSL